MAFDWYGSEDKAKLNPSESSSSRIDSIFSLIEGLSDKDKEALRSKLKSALPTSEFDDWEEHDLVVNKQRYHFENWDEETVYSDDDFTLFVCVFKIDNETCDDLDTVCLDPGAKFTYDEIRYVVQSSFIAEKNGNKYLVANLLEV